MYDVRG